MSISGLFRTVSDKCFGYAEGSKNFNFLVAFGLGYASLYCADTIDKTPKYAKKLASSVQKNVTETCVTGVFTVAENIVSSVQKASAKIASWFIWPFTHSQGSLQSGGDEFATGVELRVIGDTPGGDDWVEVL